MVNRPTAEANQVTEIRITTIGVIVEFGMGGRHGVNPAVQVVLEILDAQAIIGRRNSVVSNSLVMRSLLCAAGHDEFGSRRRLKHFDSGGSVQMPRVGVRGQ